MHLRAIPLLLSSLGFSAAGTVGDADRAWMQEMIASWQSVAVEELQLSGQIMPELIFFDATDAWYVLPDEVGFVPSDTTAHSTTMLEAGGHSLQMNGFEHGGQIALPEGDAIPPQLILFASTYGEERRPYFVFAMPEIWHATERHSGEPDLDALITGVFIHEITHTQQAETLGRRVDELIEEHGLDGDQVDDDIIQSRFGSSPEHQDAFDAERNLYFAAVVAESDAEFRELLQRALQTTRRRQAEWFRGGDALYAEFEQIFLVFEGTANWAAYRALARSGLAEAKALPTLRRGGRWWSQDLGLALYMNLERLGVDWREDAFSARPHSPFALLEEALGIEPAQR